MSVRRELETFRDADVIGRDALPRWDLSLAQDKAEGTIAENQSH
jgi:hypothetical protein